MTPTFGERIAAVIIETEQRHAGEVAFNGLAARLTAYLRGADRKRFLADAGSACGKPVTALDDALYVLMPNDKQLVLGVHGFKLRAWGAAEKC